MSRILYFLARPKETVKYNYVWVTKDGLRTQGSMLEPEEFAKGLYDFGGQPVEIFELNAKGAMSGDDEAMMWYGRTN